MVALDDLVRSERVPPPDVVKIDVEGYEYYVLKGARETIRVHRPHIVFEISNESRPAPDMFDVITTAGEGDYEFLFANGSYRPDCIVAASDVRPSAGEHFDVLARSISRRRSRAP
jgi:hypothetical protein